MAPPELASACSLNAGKSEGLGIVQVVNDFVARGAKDRVGKDFEGGQKDNSENSMVVVSARTNKRHHHQA
jgi:hypothetical protein